MIEEGVFKNNTHYLFTMIDSIGSRNILHLCSETNNGAMAIKIVWCLFKEGDWGVYVLKRLLQAWEKEEFLTPWLYADPHRFIFKYLTCIEWAIFNEKFKPRKPIEVVH